LVGDGGVWAGVARPNTPDFPLNCVTNITYIKLFILA